MRQYALTWTLRFFGRTFFFIKKWKKGKETQYAYYIIGQYRLLLFNRAWSNRLVYGLFWQSNMQSTTVKREHSYTYDVRCFGVFLIHVSIYTNPRRSWVGLVKTSLTNQILYYINLFSKIRRRLTYLPIKKYPQSKTGKWLSPQSQLRNCDLMI